MLSLHQGLLSQGIESSIITSGDVGGQSPWRADYHRKYAAELLVWSNRTELSNSHFSLDYLGKDLAGHHAITQADVVHLHWVADFLTSESIRRLAAIGKPLVWTLHDMRPFTGGCHFPAGCVGFKTDCSGCPQLRLNYFHATKHALRAMAEALESRNITFVAPSAWIADQLKASSMGRRHKMRIIPYGVDINLFLRQSRVPARKALGLSDDVQYILLASNSFAEKRKGLDLASEVLAMFHVLSSQSSQPSQTVRLLFCGEATPEIPGWIADSVGFVPPEKMPAVYSAADVMLFTPQEDNLPNVVLEAMACELPVVSHRVGGIPDMLEQIVGPSSLAKSGDVNAMAAALQKLICAPDYLREQLGQSAREVATRRFSLTGQAEEYMDLYESIVGGVSPQADANHGFSAAPVLGAPFTLYPALEEGLTISWKEEIDGDSNMELREYVEIRAGYQDQLEKSRRSWWPWILQPSAWRARRGRKLLTEKIRRAEAKVLGDGHTT
jgi:glycosyltransferase involved in cell wall biosynthesis